MTWNIYRQLAVMDDKLDQILAILTGDDTALQAQIDRIKQIAADEKAKTDKLNQAINQTKV